MLKLKLNWPSSSWVQAYTSTHRRPRCRGRSGYVCVVCIWGWWRWIFELWVFVSESCHPCVFQTADNMDVDVECVSVTLSVTEWKQEPGRPADTTHLALSLSFYTVIVCTCVYVFVCARFLCMNMYMYMWCVCVFCKCVCNLLCVLQHTPKGSHIVCVSPDWRAHQDVMLSLCIYERVRVHVCVTWLVVPLFN